MVKKISKAKETPAVVVGMVFTFAGNPYPLIGTIAGFLIGLNYGIITGKPPHTVFKYAAVGAVAGFIAGWTATSLFPLMETKSGLILPQAEWTKAPDFLSSSLGAKVLEGVLGNLVTENFGIAVAAYGNASMIMDFGNSGQVGIGGFGYDFNDNHIVYPSVLNKIGR